MTLNTTAARKSVRATSAAPRQAHKSALKKSSSKKSSANKHLLADKRDQQLFALMCRLTSNGAHRLHTNHPSLAKELGWSISGAQYSVNRLVKRGMIRKLAYHLGGYKQGTEYEVIAVSPGAHTEAERSAHAATDALIAAATNRHAINVDNVIVNVEDEAYTLLTLDLHFADTDIEPTSATAIESTLSVTPAELPSDLHFTYTSLTLAETGSRATDSLTTDALTTTSPASALPASDVALAVTALPPAAPAASDDAAPLEASELDAQRETAQRDDRLDERDLHEAYRLHRDRLIDAYLTDPQQTEACQELEIECGMEVIARLPMHVKLVGKPLQRVIVAAMRERLAAQSQPISITDVIALVREAERVRAARLAALHAG